MIEIYNEAGYIENLLRYGISSHWTRDIKLLARFYKKDGVKSLEEATENILEKLCDASRRQNNKILYLDKSSQEDRAKKTIKEAWINGEDIRKITKIEIPREAVDWFIGLEKNFVVSDEFIKKERDGFEHCGLKASIKKPIITWKRTKFLFTLYVWSMIQKEYNPGGCVYHNLNGYEKRFKEEAGIASGFNMFPEEVLLNDLGLIKLLNNDKGIVATFIQDYDEVFGVEVTDSNRVIIESKDIGEGDLYFPGYWLEKYKMGSFVCQRCGGVFAHYGTSKGEMGRKYCKDCLKKDVAFNTERKVCIECKNFYFPNKNDRKSYRCPECQAKIRRQKNTERMRTVRGLKKT